MATVNIPNTVRCNCSHCNKSLTVLFPSKSSYISCPSCKTFSKYNFDFNICTEVATFKYATSPQLNVGTKLVYDKTEYYCTGIVTANYFGEYDTWKEYYFYSPRNEQKIILVFAYYEWSLLRLVNDKDKIEFKKDKLYYNNIPCKETSNYRVEYIAAEGEFDWDLTDATSYSETEYICGDIQVINEEDDWFIGKPLTYKQLSDLLPNKEITEKDSKEYVDFDHKIGLFSDEIGFAVFKTALFFLALIIGLAICKSIYYPEREVFNQNFDFTYDELGESKEIISPDFEIKDGLFGKSLVNYNLYAEVSNSWLETSVTMVDEISGREYYFDTGVEKYSGSDWSEGSTSTSFNLESMPAGKYRMILKVYVMPPTQQNTPQTGYYNGFNPTSFSVSVVENPYSWNNFWIMFVLIFIYPLIYLISRAE
ncbi:MAG: hypothetical protein RLZZ175_1953 [Bacteroidota bacterium]|jgi:phage FluMu protein Com